MTTHRLFLFNLLEASVIAASNCWSVPFTFFLTCLFKNFLFIHDSTTLMASNLYAAAAAKSLQSCPNLCDPTDGSPLGSPIPGILQARTLKWVAISFSNAWKWKVKVKSFSRLQLLPTPWTAAYQAPPPIGFSRREYWSGLPMCSLWNVASVAKELIFK